MTVEQMALAFTTIYGFVITVDRLRSDKNKDASAAWAGLLKPMQEQIVAMQAEINELKSENATLKGQMSSLTAVNEALNRLDKQRVAQIDLYKMQLRAARIEPADVPDGGKAR